MSFVFKPQQYREYQGVNVLRIIGHTILEKFDPFAEFDIFKMRLPSGFPDHPHRGFQAITFMFSGSFLYQDIKGNKGRIDPGDIQLITAGKGVIHSQMPASFDEDTYGIQLWINLPHKYQLIEPAYQQWKNKEIQIVKLQTSTVRVIAGAWMGSKGIVNTKTEINYFDIWIEENGSSQICTQARANSLIFVYKGDVIYNADKYKHYVPQLNCCVLQSSDQDLTHVFKSQKGARFVLISAKPLKQPIFQHSYFVANTKQQLIQAFMDYQAGINGFEGKHIWQSDMKKLILNSYEEQP